MRRRRPGGDYYDDFCEPGHPWMHGHAEAIRDDIEDLTDDEYAAYRKEREEALARKRQPGFTAPWRNDEADAAAAREAD